MFELNTTHLEHFAIGIGIQLLLWPVFGRWAAAGMSVAVFLGREIAQHEAKGGGGNAVPWYYGLVYHWNMDSVLDVAAPLAGCVLLALAARNWLPLIGVKRG
ncbi:hypothetical protein ACGTN6_18080 [Halomonas sp. THAF12]|uniref:hypothetical protein n=1 Tax=Halomonas sp. B23F22_10 TaxID=3459515 RepID=UPI00373E3C4C